MARHPAGKGRNLVDLTQYRTVSEWPEGVYPGWDEWLAHPVATPLDVEPLPAFEEAVYELAADLAATLISKQADYGPKAIRNAPGGAELGILVRAHDKLARLENLLGQDAPNHESYRDSWLDLAGYAFIGLLLADGAWPR